MTQYAVDKIRNVCLMAHGHTGKTILAEAMLYNAGASDRFGKSVDGTTVTDYDPEEIKRRISINTAMAPFEWKGTKINLIDTPGYFDFVGEVYGAVRVSGGAIIPVSGKSGVAVGTEHAWAMAKQQGIPVIFFVNKMEEEDAEYAKIVADLSGKFGKTVAPFQYPMYENDGLAGYIDIVDMKAYRYDGAKTAPMDMPEVSPEVEDLRQMLVESVAETSEELMEKFFEGEEFTRDEMVQALRVGIKRGSVVPVLMGSALNNIGITALMDAVVDFFPTPVQTNPLVAVNPVDGSPVALEADPAKPLAALVFKTIADPYVGKMSLFKVLQGTLKSDMSVYNPRTEENEKIGKLYTLRGKKQTEVSAITAGDIGAVTKLSSVSTGDTLCTSGNVILIDPIEFPKPTLEMAIEPIAKGDEEKIGAGLQKLAEEDPSIKVYRNHETHQTILAGQGEVHLDVIMSKLKTKFGVEARLVDPIVPYREAIRKKVKVEGKHKKQSGGHGQYGHVWIEFEPTTEEGLVFEENIFGGSVPKNFFPAVEKGLKECMTTGVLAGYPMTGLKATLVDGSYHPVDSSEMAFKMAASIAFKEGCKQASPVLLEPIGSLTVIVPEDMMGDAIGDVNKRRGRILGMDAVGNGMQQVSAEVPVAEMHKYATDLRSMTQGRGSFSFEFVRYEEAPANIAQKVVEAANA